MTDKKKIVVLSGAGISAESGIKTFRDHNGLWENYRVEDVASIEGWYRNPSLVLDFYNQRRYDLFKAEPNGAHRSVADLEKDYNVVVITQNVDDLHERAGSSKIVHLHGELLKAKSEKNDSFTVTLTREHPEIHLGDKCDNGGQLRPAIVWFGEAVPLIEKAIEEVETADILLIIGTSMQVYPAAGLINYAPKACEIYLIDPQIPDSVSREKIHCIQKEATEGMKTFVNLLKNKES